MMAYWLWIVSGLGLEATAIFMLRGSGLITGYVLIWFGIAAVMVGLLDIAVPMHATTQLIVWLLLSHLPAEIWYRLVRPRFRDRVFARLERERPMKEPEQ